MTAKTIKAIAIVLSAVMATTFVNVLFLVLGVENQALLMTFVALLSAGFSLDISDRLNSRFANRRSIPK